MSNFGGIERSAMIQDVVVEGPGVGMLRTLTMAGGGIVKEGLRRSIRRHAPASTPSSIRIRHCRCLAICRP